MVTAYQVQSTEPLTRTEISEFCDIKSGTLGYLEADRREPEPDGGRVWLKRLSLGAVKSEADARKLKQELEQLMSMRSWFTYEVEYEDAEQIVWYPV